jgi:hypothetical protein
MGGFHGWDTLWEVSTLDPASYPEILKRETPLAPVLSKEDVPSQAPPQPQFRILVTKSEILEEQGSCIGEAFHPHPDIMVHSSISGTMGESPAEDTA